MNAKMCVQMCLLTECLLALFTFEWLLSSVNAKVFDEVSIVSEVLLALIALMLLHRLSALSL